MFLSIIVPVYNVERYLETCIESVLNQSIGNWELILVDDGSRDSSSMICDSYVEKDERIRVFHKPNGGVSSARNVGIENAQGEYISFVDADDWIERTYVEVLSREANGYDISFFGLRIHQRCNRVRRLIPSKQSSKSSSIEAEECLLSLKSNEDNFEYFGYTWDKVFKRSVIVDNGIRFIEGLSLREDELFTMDFCQRMDSVKIISDCLYNYRSTSSGLTRSARTFDQLTLFVSYFGKMTCRWQNDRLKQLDRVRLVDFYSEQSINCDGFKSALDIYRANVSRIKDSSLCVSGIKQKILYSTGKIGTLFFAVYYLFCVLKRYAVK